ncbi:MAG TPA: hypothetical protein VME68_14195 [Acidobacteriaceae bacterium]|nr:hypothetical protein [Acidobacteriaceae bacterium]
MSAAAGTQTGSGSSEPTAGAPGSPATVLSNLQTAGGNWRSFAQVGPTYADCSAPCPSASWEEIYGVAYPSLSGNATMFDLDPKVPYADALFTAGLIGQNSPQIPNSDHTLLPTLHNFTYDAWFYVVTPEVTQALEFDISLEMSGVAGMTFGHQCNLRGDGDWDIWNNAAKQWISMGVPCNPAPGWNHVTLQMQRQADNSLLYESIALNGTTYTLNYESESTAAPEGWWGLAANYQMDSDAKGSPNTTYLDDFSVTYW